MVGKKEIGEQRRALQRRQLVSANDIILVAILLTLLKIGHMLTVNWLGTLGLLLGYIIGDLLLHLATTRRHS